MEKKQQDWNGILDPRMKKCWDYYTKPKSPTFSNGKASAIRAGYSESYADTITTADWFKVKKRRIGMVHKAEKALEVALDMEIKDTDGNIQADVARVQTDVAKFIAKTLGKDEGYTERNELTGKDGKDIIFMPVELMDKYNLKNDMEDNENEVGEKLDIILPEDPADANRCDGCE